MMKSKLEQLFADAAARGFKKPMLRAHGFTFKLAPATGRNPGAIYVTDSEDGNYLGKLKDGAISSNLNFAAAQLIAAVMAEPGQEAIKWGHATGRCAICGRPLINSISIASGIGPVCAEKLGIPLVSTEETELPVGNQLNLLF